MSYVTQKQVRAARNLENQWLETINFLKNFKPEQGKKYSVMFRKEGRQGLREYIFKNVKCIQNLDSDNSLLFSFNGSDLPLLDVEILEVREIISHKRTIKKT